MPLVAPSILAADFANLGRDIEMLNRSKADWIHCDIMDGVFVPNFSFGIPVLQAVKKIAQKPLDVHLMICDADRYIETFAQAGAARITVSYEACAHLHRTLQSIRKLGLAAGVALNPHTPVSVLSEVLAELDLVLIMSVNPGFGGQSFLENTYKKVRELKKMINEQNANVLIQVDGGVDTGNAQKLVEAGVDVLVSGSVIFNATSPEKTIEQLKLNQ